MLLYFVVVLGIGVAVKRYTKTSADFFLAGRALPAWVCGLAFISANFGAQEVMGMAASGAKDGIATSHFYWIGAFPAKSRAIYTRSPGINVNHVCGVLLLMHGLAMIMLAKRAGKSSARFSFAP
jgi:hypothetical protein